MLCLAFGTALLAEAKAEVMLALLKVVVLQTEVRGQWELGEGVGERAE